MRWLLKRWWFGAGMLFVLVAICAGYLLIPVQESRIIEANCARIQAGWTLEQVQEVLQARDFIQGSQGSAWEDVDGNQIVVRFNGKGVATEARFVPTTHSAYERMKRRIEHRIEVLFP